MPRTTIGLAAAAIATLAAVAGAPAQATTSHTSITDPTGDANGLDARFYNATAPGPTDVAADPASIAALDITGATLVRDTVVVTLGKADPTMAQMAIITLATPKCDHVQIEWESNYDGVLVTGCHGTQRAYAKAPRFSGNTLTFTLPSPLPRWLPAGTKVSRIDVQTQAFVDLLTAAITPPADYASGAVDTTL